MSRLLSVSVPDDLAGALDSLVEDTGRTKSELVREALRRQVRLSRFRALQEYGRERAETRGIGPEDSEALVDELRGV
ncbi:MAG: ribbon-helix-helix protein, CopG family [Solirubrobacterales bacterium]